MKTIKVKNVHVNIEEVAKLTSIKQLKDLELFTEESDHKKVWEAAKKVKSKSEKRD